MKIFSTFTGIGGFEIGISNAFKATRVLQGIDQQTSETFDSGSLSAKPFFVGYSEIDRYASSVYEKHYPGVKNYGDITKINADELPDFDVLVGGFPCQAFSIAGKRKGFEDTRGTLFFELARILKTKTPRLFVFENVKGLLSHDNGNTFKTIIAAIDELGYDCQWQVLNSKNHGVPQNRERIIIVGHLRGTPRPKVFPFTSNDESHNRQDQPQTANTITANYWKGPAASRPLIHIPEATKKGYAEAAVGQAINLSVPNPKTRRGRVQKGLAGTLQTGQNQVVIQPRIFDDYNSKWRNDDITGTLTLNVGTSTPRNGQKVLDGSARIRRLTPLECERLQAFPDNWTKYGKDGELISDTQRYKMCGNAVTTNVIQAVFERILIKER